MSSGVVCVFFSNRFQLGGVRVGTLNIESGRELNEKVFLSSSVAWGTKACSVMGKVIGDKSLSLIYVFIESLSEGNLGSSFMGVFKRGISIHSVGKA